MKTDEQIKDAARVNLIAWVETDTPYQSGFIDGAKWMQEQDNWISVDKQKPQDKQDVQVWFADRTPYNIVNCLWNDYFIKEGATHWQPLPNPPKTK